MRLKIIADQVQIEAVIGTDDDSGLSAQQELDMLTGFVRQIKIPTIITGGRSYGVRCGARIAWPLVGRKDCLPSCGR